MFVHLAEKAWFLQCLSNQSLVSIFKNAKMVVTDVDGCLTPSSIHISQAGEEQKSFCVQDGFGITRALKQGLKIAFLSGRNDGITEHRAKRLGIAPEFCLTGYDAGKKAGLLELQQRNSISKEEIIYFGDDVLDIEVKDLVGFFASPANSLFYISGNADLVMPRDGGKGSFRLLLDLVLYIQGKHPAQSWIEKTLQSWVKH